MHLNYYFQDKHLCLIHQMLDSPRSHAQLCVISITTTAAHWVMPGHSTEMLLRLMPSGAQVSCFWGIQQVCGHNWPQSCRNRRGRLSQPPLLLGHPPVLLLGMQSETWQVMWSVSITPATAHPINCRESNGLGSMSNGPSFVDGQASCHSHLAARLYEQDRETGFCYFTAIYVLAIDIDYLYIPWMRLLTVSSIRDPCQEHTHASAWAERLFWPKSCHHVESSTKPTGPWAFSHY